MHERPSGSIRDRPRRDAREAAQIPYRVYNRAMGSPRTVVVVGGVAGGMSAATRLRRLDEKARIIVLERGENVSFANCGLPSPCRRRDRESLASTPATAPKQVRRLSRSSSTRRPIASSELMPLDELRAHAESLRGESAIVHCTAGQRGHVAAALLRQYGVTVANLDGGYLTWASGTAASRAPVRA